MSDIISNIFDGLINDPDASPNDIAQYRDLKEKCLDRLNAGESTISILKDVMKSVEAVLSMRSLIN